MDCCSAEPHDDEAQRFDGEALVAATGGSFWRRASAFSAAVAVALLPKCPACWSVYAGLSSALGVSFVLDPVLLKVLTFTSLALALLSLGVLARRRRLYAPFIIGVAAATGVWLGRFTLASERLTYLSLLALLATAFAARRLGAGGTNPVRALGASKLADHARAR